MRFDKDPTGPGIWSGGGWPAGLFYDLNGSFDSSSTDDSLSSQMEKVKYIWETPLNTVKNIRERFCHSCSHFGGRDVVVQRKISIQKRLQDWAVSVDIAITGFYKLLENALSYDSFPALGSKEMALEKPNLHLISHGYVPKIPLASRSSIRFDDLETLQNGKKSVTLQVRDFEGKPCNLLDRHAELRAVLLCNDGEECCVSVDPTAEVGAYTLRFRSPSPGAATLSVKLHGMDVAGSPVNFVVYPKKDWSEPIIPTFFGSEGIGPNEFARPWGACCDRRGRILIADRSNNRVQVLGEDGHFLFSFGKKGTGPGEFQLVAGLAACHNGDIVCVDKDNHRIQIFDENGRFKLTFGGFGEEEGKLYYPWDVDVNVRGEIVVTDSKNSRIQVFDARGSFISAFTREDNCKDFDSPRGVSFINTDTVVVSDFNTHKLYVINIKTKRFGVICKEGSGPGELKRPQGVAWHPQGFIIVGDSRNNRIQAIDLNGHMKWEIGHPDLPIDRPCGVAISHRGNIITVDFGHHRIVSLE